MASAQAGVPGATTEGRHPAGVPRVNGNPFLDNRLQNLSVLYVKAGAHDSAKHFLDNANVPPLDAWMRFDLVARYERRVRGVSLAILLGVENLVGSYWASAQSEILTRAEPRTFKTRLRGNWNGRS